MKTNLLNALLQAGAFDAAHRVLGPDRLTVLAYHRVTNHKTRDFDAFRPNVSATPALFADQLDYLAARFEIVSERDILLWLLEGKPLPQYPLFITFDDGYQDNFEIALPALKSRSMPATIFLTTGYIDDRRPFDWDLAAYCFHHTPLDEATLPYMGARSWNGAASREKLTQSWLERLKLLSDQERQLAINALPTLLHVSKPNGFFSGKQMSWEQIRAAGDAGISFGAHTKNHPILTRVPAEKAKAEIADSKRRIEAETGQSVNLFAYPNGMATDFNPQIQQMVKELGMQAAFTLLPGPAKLREAKKNRFAIRRIFVNHKDSLPCFAGKIMGASRLLRH